MKLKTSSKKMYYVKVLLPTFMTISLFVIAIFIVIIPRFENMIIERKREMIKELTAASVSLIERWHKLEESGKLSRYEAQKSAIEQIEIIRYGDEQKDYFWITDMQPKMIMHPYRPDLNEDDLTSFEDPQQKKLFVEMVNAVKDNGEGYVDYFWQWKDDSTKIVPKLSYVKKFQPWQWVIGTGIYIEDVREEIAAMEQNVITISIIISALSALLLTYIAFQNFKSEKLRQAAEDELRESREKYKMLVETSGEGLIMLLENEKLFFNKTIYSMLGYDDVHPGLSLKNIFIEYPGSELFDFNTLKFNDNKELIEQFETKLKKQNGELLDVIIIISPVYLENNKGVILSIKDITVHKEIKDELDYSREKYIALTGQLSLGVFRASPDRQLNLIEVNQSFSNLLGLQNSGELFNNSLFSYFLYTEEENNFYNKLIENKSVKRTIVHLKNSKGKTLTVLISAVLVKNQNDSFISVEGIIEDITERQKSEKEKDELISDLQASVITLHQPVKKLLKEIPRCSYNTPAGDAVKIMSDSKCTALLVVSKDNEELGIITKDDFHERLLGNAAGLDSPVYNFMSAPISYIHTSASVYDALLLFRKKQINHLVVKDAENNTAGFISNEDIFNSSYPNLLFFIENIENANSIKQISAYRNEVLILINRMLDSSAGISVITKLISMVSDAVTKRIINHAVSLLGDPPVNFCFITMGSEGREEQTLLTDQDNAIIYEDVQPGQENEVHNYFLKLGNIVSDELNNTGYHYCKGNIMASNPRWCQPLFVWQNYFTNWVTESKPKDLLDVKIFFDFRSVYGDERLAVKLKEHVNKVTGSFNLFFVYLSENMLLAELPENMQKLKSNVDLKLALLPIVDFARLYGLKQKLETTNTNSRLQLLKEKEIISGSFYNSILYSYNFLMNQRLGHQLKCINDGKTVSNEINAQGLTDIEQTVLKKTFGLNEELKNKIRSDYKGFSAV